MLERELHHRSLVPKGGATLGSWWAGSRSLALQRSSDERGVNACRGDRQLFRAAGATFYGRHGLGGGKIWVDADQDSFVRSLLLWLVVPGLCPLKIRVSQLAFSTSCHSRTLADQRPIPTLNQ